MHQPNLSEWETRDRLFDAASEAGYSFSSYQLERYRQRGLIPRPEVVGRGRGQGVESFYPPGTSDQLIALLHFKNRHDRRLDVVAAYLWAAGYPRTPCRKEALIAIIRDQLVEGFRAREEAARTQLEDFRSEGTDNVISNASEIYVGREGDAARRRVGVNRFSTVVRLALELVTGEFKGDWLDANDGDFRILAKAIRQNPSDFEAPRYQKAIIEGLRVLASIVDQGRLKKAAETATDSELEAIRDEILGVWQEWMYRIRGVRPALPGGAFRLWFMVRKTPELNRLVAMAEEASLRERVLEEIEGGAGAE